MKKSMKKQDGGTILGMIIGLLIGLAIAVAVAVMITKTSSPFTNKLGMTKPADAPEVQLTDPNRPLYGNAYKEASPHQPVIPRHEPKVDSQQEDINSAAHEDSLVNEPQIKVSPKLLPPKKATDEKSAYFLQVGAFLDPSDAENVRAKLALIGIESSVGHKTSEDDRLYRVRIGPFDNLSDMNRTRSKLVENSIDVAVIRTPN